MDIKNKAKDALSKITGGNKKDKSNEKKDAADKVLDVLEEIDPTSGFKFGIMDYGKCEFMRPCCKKLPTPCGCMAYLALAITFVGGMIGSIIIW